MLGVVVRFQGPIHQVRYKFRGYETIPMSESIEWFLICLTPLVSGLRVIEFHERTYNLTYAEPQANTIVSES